MYKNILPKELLHRCVVTLTGSLTDYDRCERDSLKPSQKMILFTQISDLNIAVL